MASTTGTGTKITRTQAQKLLSNVPEEKEFRSHDGQAFRNLRELGKGLNIMGDETYMYHSNSARNDFSRWVREVIGDGTLAQDLEKSTGRQDAAKLVEKRAGYLSSAG